MKRIVIFGNSGSGKSTMAKKLCSENSELAHLDLDTLAWLPTNPPERKPLQESAAAIKKFIQENAEWVIEGCYADLIEIALPDTTELIYLNLPVDDCIANAKSRPWEPHKYPSKEEQDANPDFLLQWIAAYETRDADDVFSKARHNKLFAEFNGDKREILKNK